MSKIFLLGYLPPLFIPDHKVEAAHYRTWQFLNPILLDGNEVCFCAVAENGVEDKIDTTGWQSNFQIHVIPFNKRGWIKALQAIYDQFSPECIIAINYDAGLFATRLRNAKPLWVDIYGDYLTIIQATNFRNHYDRGINTNLYFMREILKKADKISVCSNTQKHLSVGELALAGRLTSKSFGYDFVDVVYPGILPKNEPSAVDNRSRIRAKVNINPQDYVVLWCGGYNAWTDVETLFRGLEIAMKANPRIHFLSVGASTYSNSETQYDLFQKLIHNSEQKENFHLLDWQPWREIYGYYQASDIGVNIDALHYETIYGTRTRLLEMIGAGLPVITSLGSEISYMLHEKKAAVVFEPKNNMSLGNHLISLSQNAEIGNTVKCNAALFAVNELSFQATTKSLRDWIKHPAYAPDKNKGSRNNKENLEFFLRTATRKFLWNIWGLWK